MTRPNRQLAQPMNAVSPAAAAPTPQEVGQALQKPFVALDTKYRDLWAACATPEQQQLLKNQRDALLVAYAAGQKVALEPGNLVVADLSRQLDQANASTGKMLADLKQIVNVLNFLSEIVKVAAAVAALVA